METITVEKLLLQLLQNADTVAKLTRKAWDAPVLSPKAASLLLAHARMVHCAATELASRAQGQESAPTSHD